MRHTVGTWNPTVYLISTNYLVRILLVKWLKYTLFALSSPVCLYMYVAQSLSDFLLLNTKLKPLTCHCSVCVHSAFYCFCSRSSGFCMCVDGWKMFSSNFHKLCTEASNVFWNYHFLFCDQALFFVNHIYQ